MRKNLLGTITGADTAGIQIPAATTSPVLTTRCVAHPVP